MASRRTIRAKEAQLAFEALSIEGGLLSPEWLSKVAQLSAGLQTEADYRIPKGLNVRDEIGRYWRIAQAHWKDFAAGSAAKADSAAVAERFLTALLKESFEFESLVKVEPAVLSERFYPIGYCALKQRVPVVIAPAGSGIDTLSPTFGDHGRRRSPFGLAQEYLNSFEGALWGIVTDGCTLRILRDNASLTRPAWIEADLARIFTEERYADFAALWLLLHETRFGRDGQPVTECALETWRNAGKEEGTRAREHLRNGVEEALVALGQGFLAHPENKALRTALQDGSLSTRDYFNQLLRLVYRLIFLLTVEERNLLHPEGTPDTARSLYADGYSLRRLREKALKRSAHDRFADLWQSTKVAFRGLASGEPRLGLPALAGIFASNQCPALDAAKLENRALLLAVFKLAWLRDDGALARVNWRDMGPEELGSVYESLLELVPQISKEGRQFGFASGDETKGNARKTTGSYYTPDSLVQVLLDSALEPVIADTIRGVERVASGEWRVVPEHLRAAFISYANQQLSGSGGLAGDGNTGQAASGTGAKPATEAELESFWRTLPFAIRHSLLAQQALLSLSIVDPACGSGHFLLAAARRLASHVARLQANGTPSGAQYRHALRQVVGHCIYGVDLNPMAVELCKVSLWMEAVEPGLPLTFLNSHIQHGNALLGTTPELMAKGIPDAAWEPIEGDDRKVASALKKRNKQGATGQRSLDTLWSQPADTAATAVAQAVSELDAASDADANQLAQKEAKWESILGSAEYRQQKFIADAWCAAFVWPKNPGPLAEVAPTNELWRQIKDGRGQSPALTVKMVEELTSQYRFFHWHLQYPQVFTKGGFDVVLGNPPWEKIKLLELEFFAHRSPTIAAAANATARKKLIAALPVEEPQLWRQWSAASRKSEGESHFLRLSGRYPLCGKGDVNTYALFAEHNRDLLALTGRAGFIVPPGLATDDTTKAFFQDLTVRNGLVALFEFENEEFLFPGIDHRVRFIVITVTRQRPTSAPPAVISYANRNVTKLSDTARQFSLTPADFALLNPNTRTCPTFRSRRDAEINLSMYRRAGVLWREDDPNGSPWSLRFMAMFHMTNDSGRFRSRTELEQKGFRLEGNHFVRGGERLLPLIEAKMVHHFDHRFGTYEGQTEAQENQGKLPEFNDAAHAEANRFTLPYYWVAETEVMERLRDIQDRGWLLGWRDICRATDQRTVIATLLPRLAVGNKIPLLLSSASPMLNACLYASLSSFVLDYAARQKIGGTTLNYFILKQLPILPPPFYSGSTPWHRNELICDWLLPRVLELTYTAWDLESFARDVGFVGPPFRWDSGRRFQLRCELDAAFFHLYGLNRNDTAYIMDTFPVVRKNEEKAHGEYRTKRVILEIYDAIDEAICTGKPYQTRLDPPPADSRCCHPPKKAGVPAPQALPRATEVASFAQAYPAGAPDNLVCALALDLVASRDGIESDKQLDALILATHPDLSRALITGDAVAKLDAWAKSSIAELKAVETQGLKWHQCLDYLETHRGALHIQRNALGRPISKGANFEAARQAFPPPQVKIAGFVLGLLDSLQERRKAGNLTAKENKAIGKIDALHATYAIT
jgi:hypothetical protein